MSQTLENSSRILVIGCGGSGKTTLAVSLGAALKIPVVHLDTLFWNPGWIPTRPDEWQRIVDAEVDRHSWIMDGNYGGTLDRRIAAADPIIFLDLPRRTCLRRVVRRRVNYLGRSRPEMPDGCHERVNLEFIRWIWTYRKLRRPGILEKLAAASHARVHVLDSARAVDDFLNGISGIRALLR